MGQPGYKFIGTKKDNSGSIVAEFNTGSFSFTGKFTHDGRGSTTLNEVTCKNVFEKVSKGENWGSIGPRSAEDILQGFRSIREEKITHDVPLDCPDANL